MRILFDDPAYQLHFSKKKYIVIWVLFVVVVVVVVVVYIMAKQNYKKTKYLIPENETVT